MTQTCGFVYCTHTYWSARDARSDFSVCRLTKWGHKYMNNIPRTARRVTSRAFDRFIWVKRSSYHIYIGYRNLKGPHGNLSKYKFGFAEYITVYVIQLQQLLQLLLRIITQYAKYVYFKFYKMFTECFWVIPALMLLLILGLGDKTITICIAIDTWSISIKNVFDKTFDILYSSSEENRGCEASLVALTKALALW